MGALTLSLAIFGPLLGRGTVLLLDFGDFPVGPRPRLPPLAWGFPPGVTARIPVNLAFVALFRALPFGWVRILPYLLGPLLVAWGFSRIFGRAPLPALAATIMYLVNPFMYERMLAGQIYLVTGFSLLPLFASTVLATSRASRASRASWAGRAGAGVLLALLAAIAPHFIFIAGGLVVAVVVSALIRRDRSALLRAGAAVLVAGALSIYWLIPLFDLPSPLERVTGAQVRVFRTEPDERLGLIPNVLGLYGFWRRGSPLPKHHLPGWPLFLLAILFVIAVGISRMARSERHRPMTIALAAAGAGGFLLSLGDQGPTAPIFRFLFEDLPGFRIMREPHKLLVLLLLSYAAFFGAGLDALVKGTEGRRGRAVVGALLLALPLIYG
ncbi:MAG: hypothetical protein ACREJP_02570, partial [Candidatus Methylomirabilales bacterium]